MNRKKRMLVIIGLVIILSVVVGLMPASSVYATSPTTEITVTKYGADRTTILDTTTLSYSWLEAHLPIQGDGVTHYYTQGPTFETPTLDKWDPSETLNLKDKGALKGTALSDLCNLVGGAGTGDTVEVCASDNYGNDEFQYANVYNTLDPALNARQGKMVICWYNAEVVDEDTHQLLHPGYVPGYTKGMLLAFFAQTTNADGKYVFGHTDMHDCMPEANRHYFYDGPTQYPSTNGMYVKYVNRVNIYTGSTGGWSVALSGARTQNIIQREAENCIACHPDPNSNTTPKSPYKLTTVDGTWSGLPLWYLTGYVDDNTVIHGIGAFNDALANASYSVKITGKDDNDNDVSTTLSSNDPNPNRSVERNNNILLANKLNNSPLSSSYAPLTLVGPSGVTLISKVYKIELLNIPTGFPQWTAQLKGARNCTLAQTEFDDCLLCHSNDVANYSDGSGNWSGFPLWYLCGWVDDSNQHGSGAFSDSLAASRQNNVPAGYVIRVTGSNNNTITYSTFSSTTVARNDNIFVANKLNGSSLTSGYPLKLMGSGVQTSQQITSINKIEIAPFWDLNGDHACNIGDLVRLGNHWQESNNTARWIPEDLNGDSAINIGDLVVLGNHWSQSW